MSNLSTLFDRYKALVVFDTETSGLDFDSDQIIELAALRVERTATGGLRIAGKMDTFIKLPEGETLPENIVSLTGITDERLQTEGVQPVKAAGQIAKLMQNGPTLMIAHNAQFDACFLRGLLRGQKVGRIDWLDSLTVYKDRRAYPHKLANAIIAYDLTGKVQNSHRAIDDVLALFEVLKAMDDEREDLGSYVNLFGYNPKYGVSGRRIVGVRYGWTSVQYRVKAYDAAGAESAYTTSATRTVTNNRPPVISGTDGALGSFSTAAPSYEYTVTDADGHQVDVVEMLDGVTLRSYTVTLGQTNTLTIGSEAWLKVVNGSHTLKIVATDAKDASVTRTLTFTKAVTSVEFEQTLAMAADAMPTKALVNIQGNFPAGCTLQVWICNNGNDASPTWEDITQKARTGQKHYFTNKTKTAAAWGVKVKAKLLRGSATETCYIQSIGGNFA